MANLITRNEWNDLDQLRTEVERLFDQFFNTRVFRRSPLQGQWIPLVDLSETSSEIILNAELPGMDPSDIHISLDGRILTLRGEKKSAPRKEEQNFHRVERNYGPFSRSLELPWDVNADKVIAHYENGVLEIRLPKTKGQTARKIQVSVS
jgi:HSP20 family protein